jgi:amidophosphoribosyltransferase
VAHEIGADAVIYQELDALQRAVRASSPSLAAFETSCFDGCYVTGDITTEYLAEVEFRRDSHRGEDGDELDASQLDLNLAA